MNSLNELKSIMKQDSAKRIGTITEISEGSVLITDLLNRKFRASIPNEISIIVGNSVLVVGDVVVGKTESLKTPSVYLV